MNQTRCAKQDQDIPRNASISEENDKAHDAQLTKHHACETYGSCNILREFKKRYPRTNWPGIREMVYRSPDIVAHHKSIQFVRLQIRFLFSIIQDEETGAWWQVHSHHTSTYHQL